MMRRAVSLTGTDTAWLAMDARRRAKRRAQYRDSKRRLRARAGQMPIGYLHALSCQKHYGHRGHAFCVPVPVYEQPVKKVAA